MKRATGLQAERVNFSGAAPAILALLAGDVHMMMTSPSTVLDNIKAGKMRPLAVKSRTRVKVLPDVAAVNEAAPELRDYADDNWLGFFAPAGLPQAVATVIACAAGLSFRLLAIRFKWEMPKFVYERDHE